MLTHMSTSCSVSYRPIGWALNIAEQKGCHAYVQQHCVRIVLEGSSPYLLTRSGQRGEILWYHLIAEQVSYTAVWVSVLSSVCTGRVGRRHVLTHGVRAVWVHRRVQCHKRVSYSTPTPLNARVGYCLSLFIYQDAGAARVGWPRSTYTSLAVNRERCDSLMPRGKREALLGNLMRVNE